MNTPPASPSPISQRDAALDFTKGVLVLLMVVYHCLNYFHPDRSLVRYLRFLTPSFIFITGFLASTVYVRKFQRGDRGLWRRPFIRGLKLFLLFFGLNLLVHSLVRSSYNQRQFGIEYFFYHLDSVLLSGESRAAVFEVLLPISYLLLISGLILRVSQFSSWVLPLMGTITYVTCAFLDHNGLLDPNWELLSVGVLGMVAGLVNLTTVGKIAVHLWLLSAAYALYLVFISFRYPIYAVNVFGVCLSLLLIYGFGLRAGAAPRISAMLNQLGNYSLLAYIAQIAILQMLFRILRPVQVFWERFGIALVAAIILTYLFVALTAWAKTRAGFIRNFYRAIFA